MKIGTYLIKGLGSDEERLQKIKDAGFDFVCFNGQLFSGSATMEMCARIGLDVENIHLSGPKTTKIWSEGEEGDLITDRYCSEIAQASELGVHTGIAHITWGFSVPAPMSDTGLRRYARIAETATKYNFVLALENSVFPEYLHRVLGDFRIPAFGHCFDTGHRNAFAPTEDFLGLYGDRLAATHVQDNDGIHDIHIIPFDGNADWKRLAREFARTDFGSRMICAEVAHPRVFAFPGKSAEEIAADLGSIAIWNTDMVKIRNGEAEFYSDLGYEEFIARLYSAMSRFAAMIEEEKANLRD
ncbi:MAG: sugar phosphate isomerase/epimerase [Clostridia bacterium]|nr:sugar phosphate isomerase/epimerase [Clostridia bacterium]